MKVLCLKADIDIWRIEDPIEYEKEYIEELKYMCPGCDFKKCPSRQAPPNKEEIRRRSQSSSRIIKQPYNNIFKKIINNIWME